MPVLGAANNVWTADGRANLLLGENSANRLVRLTPDTPLLLPGRPSGDMGPRELQRPYGIAVR